MSSERSLTNAKWFLLLGAASLLASLPLAAQSSDAATSASLGTRPARPSAIGETLTAMPNTYTVGEADVLRVNVWKQPDISQSSVVVRPDGMITLPLIGEVRVTGMTPSQIETALVSDLRQYVNDPRVTVTVAEIGSKNVYVTGEVHKPGAYAVVAPVDILQIIAKAGGVTPYAHGRKVFVLREVNGQKQKLPVNYSKIFRGKNPELNLTLQPGDTVVVP